MNNFKIMTCGLTLEYPPISNTEAYALKNDPEVRELLKKSDFYIIGMRDEAKFSFDDDKVKAAEATFLVPASISMENGTTAEFVLDVNQLARDADLGELKTFFLAAGEKGIALFESEELEREWRPFAWFTPEKLIYERSRDASGICGFHNYADFGTYRLLYIGIAKSQSTLERLIDGAHDKRQEIISLERPSAGSHPSDEVILFPLSVKPNFVFKDITDPASRAQSTEQELVAQAKDLVIDAEKAIVSLFDPQYNDVKYKGFPSKAGTTEGLLRHRYTAYGFELLENLTFTGKKDTLAGSRVPGRGTKIAVDGKNAWLEKP